jgi:hypothetical protein
MELLTFPCLKGSVSEALNHKAPTPYFLCSWCFVDCPYERRFFHSFGVWWVFSFFVRGGSSRSSNRGCSSICLANSPSSMPLRVAVLDFPLRMALHRFPLLVVVLRFPLRAADWLLLLWVCRFPGARWLGDRGLTNNGYRITVMRGPSGGFTVYFCAGVGALRFRV